MTPVQAPQGCAVALGYFDGVHCGHRMVLGSAVRYAAEHGLTPAAFTFELPGNQTLKGGRILSMAQKHARIESLGIEQYLEPPFEAFRDLSPEDFVRKVLVECFSAKAVFCGDNFTFGAKAAGNVEMLHALCEPRGIRVCVVDMAKYKGENVSSTRIRAALEAGEIGEVNAMLDLDKKEDDLFLESEESDDSSILPDTRIISPDISRQTCADQLRQPSILSRLQEAKEKAAQHTSSVLPALRTEQSL